MYKYKGILTKCDWRHLTVTSGVSPIRFPHCQLSDLVMTHNYSLKVLELAKWWKCVAELGRPELNDTVADREIETERESAFKLWQPTVIGSTEGGGQKAVPGKRERSSDCRRGSERESCCVPVGV